MAASSLEFIDQFVNDAIFDSFVSIHPIIPVKVFHDLLHGFAAIFCQYCCPDLFHSPGLFGLDLKVCTDSLYMATNRWLMYHYFAMRINKTLSFYTSAQ